MVHFGSPGSGFEFPIRIRIQPTKMNADPDPQHWWEHVPGEKGGPGWAHVGEDVPVAAARMELHQLLLTAGQHEYVVLLLHQHTHCWFRNLYSKYKISIISHGTKFNLFSTIKVSDFLQFQFFRSGYGLDPESIGSSNPSWESGSGTRKGKLVTQKRKKLRNFMFEEPNQSFVGV